MRRAELPHPEHAGPRSRTDFKEAVLSFHDCFNRGRFYEAHDVLEAVWLPIRDLPEGNLWKALIQLAGAFVHVQKGRRGPALALLKLSESYLRSYPDHHPWVRVAEVRSLSAHWQAQLQDTRTRIPEILKDAAPQLRMPEDAGLDAR